MAETDGLEQPLPLPRISNRRRVITNGVNNTILPDWQVERCGPVHSSQPGKGHLLTSITVLVVIPFYPTAELPKIALKI